MLTVSDNHIVLGGGGETGASTFAALTDKATVDIPATNTPTATAINAREPSSNKKTDVDANKTSNTFFPTVKAVFDWVSGLFVKGATSSTDNAIARFDGTTGKSIKNSPVTIDGSGNLTFTSSGISINSTSVGTVKPVTISTTGTYSPEIRINSNTANAENADDLGAIIFNSKIVQSAGDKQGFIGRGTYWLPSSNTMYLGSVVNGSVNSTSYNLGILLSSVTRGRYELAMFDSTNARVGILTSTPTDTLDVNGTSRFRASATFNGQIIDNAGSSGTNGQVLKKVGGLVLWANP